MYFTYLRALCLVEWSDSIVFGHHLEGYKNFSGFVLLLQLLRQEDEMRTSVKACLYYAILTIPKSSVCNPEYLYLELNCTIAIWMPPLFQ